MLACLCRNAFALAAILKRPVIIPQLWCGQDRCVEDVLDVCYEHAGLNHDSRMHACMHLKRVYTLLVCVHASQV